MCVQSVSLRLTDFSSSNGLDLELRVITPELIDSLVKEYEESVSLSCLSDSLSLVVSQCCYLLCALSDETDGCFFFCITGQPPPGYHQKK